MVTTAPVIGVEPVEFNTNPAIPVASFTLERTVNGAATFASDPL